MAKRPAKKADPDAAPSLMAGTAGPRIVLLHGKEAFLRAERTQTLRDALIAAHGGIDTFAFDGASATPAEVLDECRSFGLMAPHKLVILDRADLLIKEDIRPLFERYAEAPSDGTTLLLRAEAWRPGKLDKLIEAVGRIDKLEPPDDRTARAWALERAPAAHACTISKDAAALLVDRVGPDLTRLDSELAKLGAASAGAEITPDLVASFVGASRDEAVWNVQSTVLSAGPEETLQHLRYVLDVSREPAQLALYALVDLTRKLHGASRALRAGANPFQLKGPLKLWGGPRDANGREMEHPILRVGRTLPPDRALALFRAAVLADQRSKTGLGDAETAVERLALQISLGIGAATPATHSAPAAPPPR